ncbi:MAG: bifunctional oligoribonuclease/PAP phosphatase NrnA [Bacteroidota bacterium]
MYDLPSLKKLCDTPQCIAILIHHRPDADALGSGLGLAAFLKKKHHRVFVIAPSPFPKFLDWMPGAQELITADRGNYDEAVACLHQADTIFCLDFSSLGRANDLKEALAAAKATKVVIDHHQDPEQFADFYFWDTKASATAELIYQVIEAMGEESLVDSDIASCLYAGIMTDTGSFRNPNTTISSHTTTAKLIQKGADTTRIYRLIYENNSLERLKFFGFAITQRLFILKEYNAAYFVIRQEDFKKFNLKTGDTEGLINYALAIEGIVLAAIIKDKRDIIRISLRSSGEIPVNEWAREHFAGGGHKNASGGSSSLSLEETVKKFKEIVKENKHLLKR